jgi:hypothetical protein
MSFGPFENVQRMVSKLSIPELTQLAKNPTGDDPNVQFAAISEIQRRNSMKAPPNGPGGPQPSVIDKMAMEAMMPQAPTPVPGDPIRSGVMAMMQQQQAGPGGPPQGMAGGGQVRGSAGNILNNMGVITDALSPHFDTSAMTPEEAQALVSQFYGSGDYLNEEGDFKNDEAQALRDRNTNLWLALAQAGFGMASTGNFGQGALMGMEQARGALDRYRDDRSNVRDRRSRNRQARGARSDRMAGAGLDALLQDRNRAERAEQSLLSASSGIASAGAQIDSANQRDRSQLQEIADALYAENRNEWAIAPPARNARLYSREDAMRDALMYAGRGGAGGRTADDLNERLRGALAMQDPANGYSAEQQELGRRIVEEITTGMIGNSNSTTRGGDARGTQSAADGRRWTPDNVRGFEEFRRSRGPTQVGERDGQPIYSVE